MVTGPVGCGTLRCGPMDTERTLCGGARPPLVGADPLPGPAGGSRPAECVPPTADMCRSERYTAVVTAWGRPQGFKQGECTSNGYQARNGGANDSLGWWESTHATRRDDEGQATGVGRACVLEPTRGCEGGTPQCNSRTLQVVVRVRPRAPVWAGSESRQQGSRSKEPGRC